MIFLSRKLIYIHVQKTGGNSVSTALLPYSDDQMTTRLHQDAVNRFGVSGKFTRRKHALLQDYQNALGPDLKEFKVALPVRDPVERAISLYFSPRRWMVENNGTWEKVPPQWDIDKFTKFMARCFTLTDFIEVDGKVQMPDHVIRFTHLQQDFEALCAAYDFPVEAQTLPQVNQSTAPSALRQQASQDPQAIAVVKERFAADYALIRQLD